MMDRRIAKFFVLSAALLLALPVVASAQTSRVESMTLQGDYIKDYTGIYTYTAQVPNVGNLVYGELGNLGGSNTLDRSVGAVLGNLWDGRFGTWAIHLREDTPQLGQGDAFASPAPGFLGFDPNANHNESFDIMWGKKMGTTSVGLRLNRSFEKLETNIGGVTTLLKFDQSLDGVDGTENSARNILGLGGGIGFEMSPTTNVEMSVLWQQRTFVDRALPGTNLQEDGPSTYVVAARAMWQWQPNVLVVPVFKWYSYDLSAKDLVANTSSDNSLSGWQIGAAGNWTLGSNDLFVLGATFAQNKVEQQDAVFGSLLGPPGGGGKETLTESLSPVIFAALEAHVNSWLTARFGASKAATHNVKDESGVDTIKETDSPFAMNLGAGMKFGPLQIDAILNNFFPHVGPYFLSGVTAGPMFPKVTVTYPW